MGSMVITIVGLSVSSSVCSSLNISECCLVFSEILHEIGGQQGKKVTRRNFKKKIIKIIKIFTPNKEGSN